MKFVLTDIYDKVYIYLNPLSVTLNRNIGVPADSLTVLFIFNDDETEFSNITVYDGKKCVFKGVVDEQIETIVENGRLLEINARSMAALLLDNEAMPQSCYLPNMKLLMDRNFSKLGFTEYIGTDNPKSGSINIDKGTSEWSVLERYCKKFLGKVPIVNEYGVIDISGGEAETVIIPNDSNSRILSVKRIKKRCKLISEYRVRGQHDGYYEMIINNEKAKDLGIRSIRYLNAVDNKNFGVDSCYDFIKNSNGEYETVEIVVSGKFLVRTGDYIIASGYPFGNLRVMSVRYELDGEKEVTRLVMNVEGDDSSVDSRKYGKKEYRE